tara:strand:+ start:704 stop:4288 length:3585 start_codon:yes stop_codon:yes gene_type:complete
MSQFQQPNDNRYVRPGVLDLGTGRQFERLSVSQRGEGSIGSGAQGGGFVQGQSRVGTGLSGVDPLAQILGTASNAMSSFLQADKTMMQAVDRRTNRELDEMEQARQDDLLTYDPEEAADRHRTRLDDWRKKNGKLSKRGTARAKWKEMNRNASKTITDLDFENDYLAIQDLITTFGGNEELTIPALEQWAARYEGTPYEETAIRQTRDQLQNARNRKVAFDLADDARTVQHRFKGLLEEEGFGRWDAKQGWVWDPAKIHGFATSVGIDLDDEEAQLKLGEEFLGMMDDRLSDLDFASRENIIRSWATMFDAEAKDFVYLAKAYQQDVDRTAASARDARNWNNVLENPFSITTASTLADMQGFSTRDMSPQAAEDRRQESIATSSRVLADEYSEANPTITAQHSSRDKGMVYAGMLVEQSLAAAGRVDDPELAVQILNGAHLALPKTLDEAYKAGWLAEKDMDILTEEDWSRMRVDIDQEIRAKQAAQAGTFFKTAADKAVQTRDMALLERLGSQLITLAGEEETAQGRPGGYGLSEDGQSVKILPLSQAGEVFGKIETDLLTSYNQLLSKTSSGSGETRVMTALRGGDRGFSYEMKVNGKDVEVPRSHFEASAAFNGPAELFDDLMSDPKMTVEEATDAVAKNLIETMAAPDGSLPPMVTETLAILDMIPKENVPPALARGMLALAPALGYQRTTGSTAGEGHRNIIGRQAQGMVSSIMDRATAPGGPGLVGEDALTIATMYMAAGTPEMRESLFPNADDRIKARRAARLLKSEGTFMDGDKFRWSGATAEDFRGQELTYDNTARGYAFLERQAASDGKSGFANIEVKMVEALLDPMAGLPDGSGIPRPIELAIMEMKSNKADWIPDLLESLGLPEDTNLRSWINGNTNAVAIQDEISLRVANFLGTNEGQNATQKPEDMAEALGEIVTTAIETRLEGQAIFEGFGLKDPKGGIRQLQQRANGVSSTGGDLLSAALDFSVHDAVLKRGMTVMTPEATAQHLGYTDMGDHFVDSNGNPVDVSDNSAGTYQTVFQDMFKDVKVNGQPLFSGDDFDFGAVWQRALDATPNNDPRQVSMGDLLFYSWDKEGKGGENFTRTRKILDSTEIREQDGRIIFRIQDLNVEFEYSPPLTQSGGLSPMIYSSRQSIIDQQPFKVTPEMRQQQFDQGRARYLYEMSQPGHFMVPRTTADGRTPQG